MPASATRTRSDLTGEILDERSADAEQPAWIHAGGTRIIIRAARAGQPPGKRFQPAVEPFAHNNNPKARHSFDVLPVPPVAAMVSRGC